MRGAVATILALAAAAVLLALIAIEFVHPTDISFMESGNRFEFEMAILDAKRDLITIVVTGLIAYLMAKTGKKDD